MSGALVSMALILMAQPQIVAAAEAAAAGPERRSRLVMVSAGAPGGLELSAPMIIDRIEKSSEGQAGAGRGPRLIPRITAFEIRVEEAPAVAIAADIRIVVTSASGQLTEASLRAEGLRTGETVRIPFDLPVSLENEGAFGALVRATTEDGAALFEGEYRFGYPRYTTAPSLERIHDGAPIREGFEGGSIDENRWRIWLDNPDKVRLEVRGGRLHIHAEGSIGYNGLVSLRPMPQRDVEAVCLVGVETGAHSAHPALVHLCGLSDMSPDNWFEMRLQQGDPGEDLVSSHASVPPPIPPGNLAVPMSIPSRAPEGQLIRIVSDPASRLLRGMVLVEDSWVQAGPALEVPARAARLEIKTEGFRRGLGASTLWFDDCRIYPRPQTHDVTLKLQRSGGGIPGIPGPRGLPMILYDAENASFTNQEITVKLYKEDGRTLAAEAHPGGDLRYATFSLLQAPWEIYPAGAVVKIFLGERQLGNDLTIPLHGVEGLYPDDVWLLTLE